MTHSMQKKLESAFNIVVKYGFCGDCRHNCDSKACHEYACYKEGVGIIIETLEKLEKQSAAEKSDLYDHEEYEFIKKSLSVDEFLCQLAEECSELSQAALKYRRSVTGTNPTRKTKEDCWENLTEELADVIFSARLIGLFADDVQEKIRETIQTKMVRWAKDLGYENRKEIKKT